MVLYYLLLAPCLYQWYSTTFYWLSAYNYGTLLPSTNSLPITLVFYYLLLITAYTYGTLVPFTGSLSIYMILYYLLLAHCLLLWNSTIFYWLTAYNYGTLLSSTGFLPLPMVFFYLLLAHCL